MTRTTANSLQYFIATNRAATTGSDLPGLFTHTRKGGDFRTWGSENPKNRDVDDHLGTRTGAKQRLPGSRNVRPRGEFPSGLRWVQ